MRETEEELKQLKKSGNSSGLRTAAVLRTIDPIDISCNIGVVLESNI